MEPGPERRRSSVKDVATEAGVSLGTVSNVLNRPEMVSEATRLRVERAMTDLGFVRNESARQLRVGASSSIGYVMLDAKNPFFTDVAEGIEIAAESESLSLFLCNSGQRSGREAAHLNLLQQYRVRGILITPVDPDSPALDEISGRGTPVVVVDRTRRDASLCSVAVEDVLGGELAVEHLLDLGHRRVAFVGGPVGLGQVRDRLEGARRAMAAADRDPADLVVMSTDALDVRSGFRAGELLAGIPSARRPTAAVCANDLVALGLLQQAIGSGVDVPGRLAIIGYDDIDFAGAAAVPLTSVRQPRQELGRAAARLLVEELTDPGHRHQQIHFTPELVARASTIG